MCACVCVLYNGKRVVPVLTPLPLSATVLLCSPPPKKKRQLLMLLLLLLLLVLQLKELYESGEINKETKVWAQGLEGWKPLRLIPQLKWCVTAYTHAHSHASVNTHTHTHAHTHTHTLPLSFSLSLFLSSIV